ncbi:MULTISPECIES: BON domain-containing protein [unclassified Duganella]|uniref:BON domain-containing protein n=1 Tax=unclassified Duganella TaxID=2636909 RepID=UPI000E34C6A1|nr:MULTISPECIES: BON domain-containing protein [unclassified Duganella]RFP14941.1 BON domain-containing protein [Duganella sp. BJB475]RFP31291.1 BON domain-containing protein [Duganella sp. BJB476]
MNKILLFVMATAASASFAATTPNNDTVAYKATVKQAEIDYKSAKAACGGQSGTAKDICIEQAKVARANSEANATMQYKNDKRSVQKAQTEVADADYNLAKAKCAPMAGADKDSCLDTAKSTHVAAINDAKAGKKMADVAQTGIDCSTMSGADKASCETKQKSSMAKDTVADSMITTKVKTELLAEPALKSLDVHVETTNGTVMLSGFVPSQAEVDKAVDVARNVKGVNKVQSSLRIK